MDRLASVKRRKEEYTLKAGYYIELTFIDHTTNTRYTKRYTSEKGANIATTKFFNKVAAANNCNYTCTRLWNNA